MTYPCLVLDHDDTVVNSTATVHYPCFAEYTAKFFPRAKRYTLEEYVLKNFDPGVYDFFHGEVGMTEEDMKHEQAYWHEYVQHHVPQVYDGMRDILWDYVHAGGTICVVSHSLSPNILRDYRENKLPEPKLVYGWEVPKDRRKPADPQTSGGLLVALPREDAEPLLRELQTFAPWSAIVGEVSELRATALEFD